MNEATLIAAASGSNTTSGAVLTLVLPIAFTLVMLAIWFLVLRSGRRRSHRG